jgi:DNA repair ATPase RecN
MELSIKAINLLKHVLQFDGTKETDLRTGQEVNASRKLNGEESSQRNHFNKAVKPLLEAYQAEYKELADEFNKKAVEQTKEVKENNPKNEEETDKEYNQRINNLVVQDKEYQARVTELSVWLKEKENEIHTFEITDKTKEVVKKYYDIFGNEVGFAVGDDEVIETIKF